MEILSEVWVRVLPVDAPEVEARSLLLAAAVALAIVVIGPLWRLARLGVTLVHELGHALVGLACGRSFTGLVLRADASGHAVTRGPERGAGRALTTWAGYPAPAIAGAAAIAAATWGWAAPVLTLALVAAAAALVRARSWLTGSVTLAVTAGLGLLWWRGDDAWQAWVLIVAGGVGIVGAWRHLGAVAGSRSPTSDPAVLAWLTRVPAAVWNVSFALACGAATWFAGSRLWALWPGSLL
ncbi:M50 family metallopeptidase [Pseudactinotalea sp. HY158]|uniref:M50 family metallopeptidase n=1 Tax=Pseudactinotalea sp. HY158 TaxID=2654547 RepID=UPI00129C989C|nr:M50 family metallopeptidase [Pseudactinotalea sp. HY158]QGH70159.1 M50 family peptidase [Pseudactinotalea sp. HY158]